MPVLHKQILLPYSKVKLFDLVLDINSYPKFLPWCAATRILNQNDSQIIAEMVVKYSAFRSSYTSKVVFDKQDISVELVDGPFNYLINKWHFKEQSKNLTLVEFYIDLQLKAQFLENILNLKFEDYSNKLIDAFKNRAQYLFVNEV